MKHSFKTSLLTTCLCVGIAGLFAGTAEAGNKQYQSFNTTNQLVNGVNYFNYPTNSPGIATGAGINIDNYPTVGFALDCDVTNNAAAKVWVALVRSHQASMTASSVTNNTGTTNWETTVVYSCFISVPAMTNHFTWLTNLPNDFAGCAREVGIGSITNNLASGQQVNNLDIGLVKGLTPIVYP